MHIKLTNFGLFETADINLAKINLLIAVNYDTETDDNGELSGNGAGKTHIVDAITFLKYGDVVGKNLKDLIRFGAKEAIVEGEFSLNGHIYKIIRKIPTALFVYVDGVEKQFNTNTLAQRFLDEQFGEDLNTFRTYRILDNKKGINLLDLGAVSLRKSLMAFVDTQFSLVRKSLLDKKLERETYNVSKRLYQHSLSQKRVDFINSSLNRIEGESVENSKEIRQLNNSLNQKKSELQSLVYLIQNNKEKNIPAKDRKCPTCGTILGKTEAQVIAAKSEGEIQIMQKQKEHLEFEIKENSEELLYLEAQGNNLNTHYGRLRNYKMRLEAAFKFANYKYTAQDVALYAESVKVLDGFASYYVSEWLGNLALIINDLLRPMNMSVTFNLEKDFISIAEAGRTLKYEQSSGAQQRFLNCVLKLAILLSEGKTTGEFIVDEGINEMDGPTLNKFLEVLRPLNFTSVIVYQKVNRDLQDVNYINIDRADGKSEVK